MQESCLSLSKFTVLLLFAGGFCMVTSGKADDCGNTEEVLTATDPKCALSYNFEAAGMPADEAELLAMLLVHGPVESPLTSYCEYYSVTMRWCVDGVRHARRADFNMPCIDEAIDTTTVHLCEVGHCWHYMAESPASECEPHSGKCLWVTIAGPYETRNESGCEALLHCDCLVGLGNEAGVCVPCIPGQGPVGCPECP